MTSIETSETSETPIPREPTRTPSSAAPISQQFTYEHKGQPVSRQAFYAIACNPQRSVAVEACAGAGKT